MDASAYLKKQGWRGDGHSLDHTNRGIRKPLLVSKKVDVLGLGTNKHAPVSDQWWLRAFDQGLKNLGTGKESVLSSIQKHGINRGGLYGRFVQGENYEGSIGVLPHTGDKAVVLGDVVPRGGDSAESTTSTSEEGSSSSSSESESESEVEMAGTKKRKREEDSAGKRARQKMDTTGALKELSEVHGEAEAVGNPFDPVKEAERRKKRQIEAQVDRIVLEAQRRGIIPLGPNEVRKRIVPLEDGADDTTMPTSAGDDLDRVLAQIGLKGETKVKASGNIKAQKYAREKMKRDLRRAAKAHLLGEKPPEEQTKEERNQKKDKRRARASLKKAEAAKKDAERIATREERSAKKRESRARRAAEKAETMRIKDERHEASKAGKTLDDHHADRARKEAAASAEVALAEQILKDRGIDLTELDLGKASEPKKIDGKKKKKSRSARNSAPDASISDLVEVADGAGFVIDTEGDASLTTARSSTTARLSRSRQNDGPAIGQAQEAAPQSEPQPSQPWDDVDVKTPALSNREAKKAAKLAKREERGARSLPAGDEAPVTKKKAKGQRKVEAREAFMKQILYHSRRALRDRQSGSTIALDSTGPAGTATVDGIANVPLVKVETSEGQFKKAEVSAARTVARRVQRMQKREDRAKKGKGKGWKKRERAANDMEKNAAFLAPMPKTLVRVAA